MVNTRPVFRRTVVLVTAMFLLGVLAGCRPDAHAPVSGNAAGPESLATADQTTQEAFATSTTGAPGHLSFAGFATRFEQLVTARDLPGTLPYETLSADEVAWVFKGDADISVTDAAGYGLANGDVAVLFFCRPIAEDRYSEAERVLLAAAPARFIEHTGGLSVRLWGDCGLAVCSEHYARALDTLSQWARVGLPMEHYLEPMQRPFVEVIGRFEERVMHDDREGSLPFALMTADAAGWVSSAMPEVVQVAGYGFANGALCWLLEMARFPSYEAMQAARTALTVAAQAEYGATGASVYTSIEDDFGYVIVAASEDARQELMLEAEWARWSGPPDW